MNIERSFFLYKPDILQNKEAKKLLLELLTQEELIVLKHSTILLSEDDVEYLWPAFINDYISLKVLKLYLSEKNLPLVEVIGLNAINKCLKIKKQIRETYAKNKFSNCVHSPSNKNETEKSFLLFNSNNKERLYYTDKNITENPKEKFSKISYLTISEKNTIATKVWNKVKNLDIDDMKKYNISNKKFLLFILNDEENFIEHIISCINQYFSDYTVDYIYILTLVAETIGKVLIKGSNNYEEILNAQKYFQKNNIITIIEKENT